jgi:hypothetical protein
MGLKDPIGKFLTKDEGMYQKLRIVGVVEDMVMQSPYAKVKQMIYAFDRRGAASYYNIRLNPEKSATESLTTIQSIFKKHFPDIPYSYQLLTKNMKPNLQMKSNWETSLVFSRYWQFSFPVWVFLDLPVL